MTPTYPSATKKGYEFYEVASALQKAVRRGDEEVALYFTVELFNSGYGEYVWKRLRLICSEDIGLAEPTMPAVIQALYQSYLDLKKKNDHGTPERLFLVHAVLLLCRAKKSRLIDWMLIAYWDGHDTTRREIPDYAFDKHTQRGRRMGRGVAHFWDEASRLENYSPQPGEEEAKQAARKVFKNGRSAVAPPTGALPGTGELNATNDVCKDLLKGD